MRNVKQSNIRSLQNLVGEFEHPICIENDDGILKLKVPSRARGCRFIKSSFEDFSSETQDIR